METTLSAIESSQVAERPRVDVSAPASRRPEILSNSGTGATKALDPGQVQQAADRINEAMQSTGHHLVFSVHKDTGQMVVQVTDASGKVIQQIPSEQLLKVEANIGKVLGLFVNNHA